MQKSDYVYMIVDNVLSFMINLPAELQGDNLNNHLAQFDEKALAIVAGFSKSFLEHFLIISKGKTQKDIDEILKKMEKISFMIGPTGNLSYLGPEQIEYILTKLGSLQLNEITEEKISLIGDEHLENQFGSATYDQGAALENQLASAAFYLMQLGYPDQEIKNILNKARQDPSKLDEIFNMAPKEILSLPQELQQGPPRAATSGSSGSDSSSAEGETTAPSSDTIESYISQIEQEQQPERAQKVAELVQNIKDIAKEHFTEQHERVYRQMHPDRLSRAFKMLKDTKKKSNRIPLIIEWYFSSHLIENIEFKVEHWQTSATAGHGQTGVYTAGISFSRYDPIIKDFDDGQLAKVINICRRILQTPSKRAIQKLGQDLTAETGFDEHLYFTD